MMDLYGKHDCPVDALVGHPDYGRGTVLWKVGDRRMVNFQERLDKSITEMSAEEVWANSCWGDDVVGIAWTETQDRFVPVSQLKLFSLYNSQ